MDRDQDNTEQDERKVIISDMRHSRNEEDVTEEASPVAEPELELVEQESPVDQEPEPGPTEQLAAGPGPAPEAPADPEQGEPSAEFDQIKMIFEAGLPNYLKSQVTLLANFAMIYLGQAANPATGLVSVDLENAKMAIDMLEFIMGKVKAGLPKEEQDGFAKFIADLKYSFMQAASSSPTQA